MRIRSVARCSRGGRTEPENPRSTGVRLQYGRFRFLDVGDLTGAPLHALACPTNMVGPIEIAYLVAHPAAPAASDPATFAAFRPRVAIVNSGAMKGGANELLAALHDVPNLEDSWQLHQSARAGRAERPAIARIANVDDSDGHWIKLSASQDGSFTVTNGRTGDVKA